MNSYVETPDERKGTVLRETPLGVCNENEARKNQHKSSTQFSLHV